MATNMEVDSEKVGVSSPPSVATGIIPMSSGSVSVALHPLVIMNISEHWTRVSAQEGKPTQVVGALIGKQKGRNIEVMNSFELLIHQFDGDVVIDRDYYSTKEDQFKQVFSDMDFLGWYNTGELQLESDLKVHKQICQINESPVFLKLNALGRNAELPVSIYESVIDLVEKEAKMRFVELPYVLATEEAERIGVDHVARVSINEAGEMSAASEHLSAQYSAIKMLHSRVKLVLDYIESAQQGLVPMNHEILREAYSLCHRLPVLNTEKFREEFYDQYNDVSLITYMGVLTKTCNTVNQFVNKFNMINDRQQMSRRMRGGLLF